MCYFCCSCGVEFGVVVSFCLDSFQGKLKWFPDSMTATKEVNFLFVQRLFRCPLVDPHTLSLFYYWELLLELDWVDMKWKSDPFFLAGG